MDIDMGRTTVKIFILCLLVPRLMWIEFIQVHLCLGITKNLHTNLRVLCLYTRITSNAYSCISKPVLNTRKYFIIIDITKF